MQFVIIKNNVMNISNDPAKMEIVSRLIKEGVIDFVEAMKLLEKEVEFTAVPISYPSTGLPPWSDPYNPFKITCGDKTNTPLINEVVSTSKIVMTNVQEVLEDTKYLLQ